MAAVSAQGDADPGDYWPGTGRLPWSDQCRPSSAAAQCVRVAGSQPSGRPPHPRRTTHDGPPFCLELGRPHRRLVCGPGRPAPLRPLPCAGRGCVVARSRGVELETACWAESARWRWWTDVGSLGAAGAVPTAPRATPRTESAADAVEGPSPGARGRKTAAGGKSCIGHVPSRA
jgi:hypothetical protein